MIFRIDGYNALRAALQKMCGALEGENLSEGAVFNCKLVADELVSNALQHGGGSAVFSFEREGDSVRIVVKSADDFAPPEDSTCSGCFAESGRGLFLVDAVSETRLYSREEGISVTVRITGETR